MYHEGRVLPPLDMKRNLKIGLVILAVLIGGFTLLFASIFYATSGLTKIADDFLLLLQRGQVEQAYQTTSMEFQKGTSLEQLELFVSDMSLTSYQSATWNSRSMSLYPSTAEIGGTLVFGGVRGSAVPATVSFTKEDGIWKIVDLNIQGGMKSQADVAIPNGSELKALVKQTMNNFASAAKKGDFTDFYQSISTLWKTQTTAEELKIAFAPVVNDKMLLSAFKNDSPVISANPSLDENRSLVIDGYYPLSDGAVVLFTQKYTFEFPSWKLLGLSMKMKD